MWLNLEPRLVRRIARLLTVDAPKAHKLDNELASAITHWTEIERNKETRKYRKLAENMGADGELEFDSDAVVSVSEDGGAYVMGWVWIDDPAYDPED